MTALNKALAEIDAKFALTPEQVARNELKAKYCGAADANDIDAMADLFISQHPQYA